MLIISIVPRLPPAIDGVGDYALCLARQLRKDFKIETVFIIGNLACEENSSLSLEGFQAEPVLNQSAENLSLILNKYSQKSTSPTIVLLHYSGYGYAKRGCPIWLIEGLKKWKSNVIEVRLLTMFHELYHRFESPFKSGSWLSFSQKKLVKDLAQLSNFYMTNRQEHAKILNRLSSRKQEIIPVLPVFSNVGEPNKNILPLSERQRRLVIFGQRRTKLRVYQESSVSVIKACQALNIQEIWDIGESTGLNLSSIGGVSIAETGKLSTLEISEILSSSVAGFLNYNTTYLAKSGIFAAYCAHGILPISYRRSALAVDGIESGQHYWIPEVLKSVPDQLEELQKIADNAYLWYQSHTLPIHAQTLGRAILSK